MSISYNLIFNIYKENKIECLDDKKTLKQEYHSIMSLFSDLNFGIKEHALITDILNCSKDIKYTVGNLFLYRNYINNPLEQVIRVGNIELFPNYQNIEDRRYSMYASIASEKLYNYWNRIGDLINMVLMLITKSRNVYFWDVVDKLPESLTDSENYKWLKEFKDGDYSTYNDIRRNVVHFRQLETDYYVKHLDLTQNREEIERLQSEKENYATNFKDQLEKTIIGFEKTIKLLAEYNAHRKNKRD